MGMGTGRKANVGSPDWSPTGGNPGGYIYDTDMDNGGWGFLAPSEFKGVHPEAYGEKLSFEFLSDRIENETAGVALATPAQIQATLSDLEYLFLGAEFADGFDNDGTYEYGELVAYDNVILVPEPATIFLIGFGVLALGRRRRA